MARGAAKLVSVNGALTVTFTAASGSTPAVFSDEACTSAITLPATVADGANTTFYFASPGAYTLSVKTSAGTQIAGDLGSTRTISVTTGEVAVLTYDTRIVARDASGDSGRNAVNAALSGTYPSFSIVNARPNFPVPMGYTPWGLAMDSAGNIYTDNNDNAGQVISKITPNGVVSTFANDAALAHHMQGLVFDSAGNLWVTLNDTGNIVKINGTTGAVMATYPVTGVAFDVASVCIDAADNMYVACHALPGVYKVTPAGAASSFAIMPSGQPLGIGIDSAGNLYVSTENPGRVYKVTPAGVVTLFATLSSWAYGGVAVDADGYLYVPYSGGAPYPGGIFKITPAGVSTTWAQFNSVGPVSVMLDKLGAMYVTDSNNKQIVRVEDGVQTNRLSVFGPVEIVPPIAQVNGTTAGIAYYVQPFTGATFKKVLVRLSGYQNSTVTAQTITFPVQFQNVPAFVRDDTGAATKTATTLTLPVSMGAPVTGWILLEGF